MPFAENLLHGCGGHIEDFVLLVDVAYAEQLLEDDPALEKASNALLLKELRKDKYNIKDYSKIS